MADECIENTFNLEHDRRKSNGNFAFSRFIYLPIDIKIDAEGFQKNVSLTQAGFTSKNLFKNS